MCDIESDIPTIPTTPDDPILEGGTADAEVLPAEPVAPDVTEEPAAAIDPPAPEAPAENNEAQGDADASKNSKEESGGFKKTMTSMKKSVGLSFSRAKKSLGSMRKKKTKEPVKGEEAAAGASAETTVSASEEPAAKK